MPFYPDPIEEYDNSDPVYCRSCGGYLGERETVTANDVEFWNGHPWCPEHAEEMRQLAKTPDHIDQVRR
jgi:hypothetical protein